MPISFGDGVLSMASEACETKAMKILLVEDEIELLDLFARRLVRAGFDVVSASTAEDAIDMLQDTDFDAVISDIQLPGKSGFDVFDFARTLPRKVFFFFVTGHGEGTPEMRRAFSLGVDGVYSKPVCIKVLIDRLREVFSIC